MPTYRPVLTALEEDFSPVSTSAKTPASAGSAAFPPRRNPIRLNAVLLAAGCLAATASYWLSVRTRDRYLGYEGEGRRVECVRTL
jgi:hypothetical protein